MSSSIFLSYIYIYIIYIYIYIYKYIYIYYIYYIYISYIDMIHSPVQLTMPTNIVCHSQLIYCFIETQNQHQVSSYFLPLSCFLHIAFIMDLLVPRKIPILLQTQCFTSIRNCWPYMALGNRSFQL